MAARIALNCLLQRQAYHRSIPAARHGLRHAHCEPDAVASSRNSFGVGFANHIPPCGRRPVCRSCRGNFNSANFSAGSPIRLDRQSGFRLRTLGSHCVRIVTASSTISPTARNAKCLWCPFLVGFMGGKRSAVFERPKLKLVVRDRIPPLLSRGRGRLTGRCTAFSSRTP